MSCLLHKTLSTSRRRALSLLAKGRMAFGLPQDLLALNVSAEPVIDQPATPTDKSFIQRAFDMRQLAVEKGDQGCGRPGRKDYRSVMESSSY